MLASRSSAPLSACGEQIPDFMQELRERFARDGRTDPRPLLVNPGHGTTGTRSLDSFASCCGLRTWKYGPHARHITLQKPKQYRGMNYTHIFRHADFASDTPVPFIWPYMLAAFPNAVVLHSTRNATEWVRSRTTHHSHSARPFAWLFDTGGMQETAAKGTQRAWFRMAGSDPDLDALGYMGERLMVRCSVPADRYLEVPMPSLCTERMQAELRRRMNCPSTCKMPGCGDALAGSAETGHG